MRTLYTNCKVHTFSSSEIYTAIGVEKGRISYLGNEIPKGYKVVDLNGAHIAPRLFDSHMHLLYTIVLAGQSFFISEVKDDGVYPKNAEDALSRLKAYSASNPKAKIIVANGFIPTAFSEPRLLTREELDSAAPGKAVVVYTIDGHSSTLSTKMMEAIGLDVKAYPDGILRGEAHEFNQGKITGYIASSVKLSTLIKGIAGFINNAYSSGLSGFAALDGNEDGGKDLLTRVLALIASKLPLDIILYPQYQEFDKADVLFNMQRRKRLGGCSSWELDGAVNSMSAAFYSPYRNSEDSGHKYYEDEFISSQVKKAIDDDILLSAHAIGPAAIDQLIAAYSENKDRLHKSGGMYRIDHAEFPSRLAVENLKNLDIAVTIQPGFSYIDKRYLKSYEAYLTEKQLGLLMPLKELSDSGVCLLGSSDSPVQEIDPFLQMKGMIHYYNESQSIKPEKAYGTYSINAGKAQGRDFSLAIGNEATFNVYRKSPLEELCREDLVGVYIKGKVAKKIKRPLLYAISLLFRRSKLI
ncbi:MAG: amidohydrolase family protein [Spirochaetales bacterium]|nr:amidohydrolase family protein [Spirochaetales bacterium]